MVSSWRDEVGEDLMKPVSIRAFGRWLNVSDTAVHKAMKAGKISGNAIAKDGKIIPKLAADQWGKVYDPRYGNSRALESKFVDGASSQGVEEGGATLAAAKRAKAVYDAKLAELEYKEKAGILVKQEDVYRNLFGFGQEIRSRLQAIPDRVIDEILACKGRNQAHLILYNAISIELEFLSELGNKKIA